MNYLAHLLLSGPDADVQVGGLLGDFVKGPLRGEYPEAIEFGIFLHRRLDVITDAHPAFIEVASQVPPPWRRFRGIIVDVYFDHLLATRWQHYHDQTLDDFCAGFYRHLHQRRHLLPPRALHFSRVAPQVRWLESYRDRDTVPIMLDNLGKRLKRPVALGEGIMPLLDAELSEPFDYLLADLLSSATLLCKEHLRQDHQRP